MSNHITGHTGLLCLLGSPVAHSVSPEMHNEACSQLGLDYTYLAFDVPEEKMPQAVEGLRTMGARLEYHDAGQKYHVQAGRQRFHRLPRFPAPAIRLSTTTVFRLLIRPMASDLCVQLQKMV